jgi:hypothetical protein
MRLADVAPAVASELIPSPFSHGFRRGPDYAARQGGLSGTSGNSVNAYEASLLAPAHAEARIYW